MHNDIGVWLHGCNLQEELHVGLNIEVLVPALVKCYLAKNCGLRYSIFKCLHMLCTMYSLGPVGKYISHIVSCSIEWDFHKQKNSFTLRSMNRNGIAACSVKKGGGSF